MESEMTNSQQARARRHQMISSGDWRLFFLNYEEMKNVTPEDVVRVAKLYFKAFEHARLVSSFPTPSRTAPWCRRAPDIASLFKNYQTSMNVSAGEAFDPHARQYREASDARDAAGGPEGGACCRKRTGAKPLRRR